MDRQGHLLASELAGEIIRVKIDLYKALTIDFAHQMLPFHVVEPSIGID